MRDLFTNPTGYILSSSIKRKHFIQILVIQLFFYSLLDMAKIHYHPIGIEFRRTAVDCDNPIVTMKIFTFTTI